MSETICNCMGVTKDEIINAIKGGATTVEAVTEETQAGSACGGCIPKIEELIEQNA